MDAPRRAGLAEDARAVVVVAAPVLFSNTSTMPGLVGFGTSRSGLPSPLTSTADTHGAAPEPVEKSMAGWKVPLPSPSITLTKAGDQLAASRSGIWSPFTSAMVMNQAKLSGNS